MLVDRNVYRFMTGANPEDKLLLDQMPSVQSFSSSPLAKLIAFIWKCTEENDTGIRNEGGRVVATVVKACHQAQGSILA